MDKIYCERETATEMHCGMCEHDWRGHNGDVCPNCGSDHTETLAMARTHNQFVITREHDDR